MKTMRWLCMLWSLLLVGTAVAQVREVAVPPALEPWRDWVLDEQVHRRCPLLSGGRGSAATDFLCAWPGPLSLQVDGRRARFVQRWTLDAPGWVPLPGEQAMWPGNVTVDGQARPVSARQGGPMLWLSAGSVEVRGEIEWEQRPQALRVPLLVGVVELNLDGRSVRPVEREGEQVTLGRVEAAAGEADALDVRVFRRLVDGLPAHLETRLELAGSGEIREQRFGRILPEGFVALSLRSDWPARLDADGGLRVQVQPDMGELVLIARATAPLAAVEAPAPEAWPAQEVWSYQATPQLRITQAEGPLSLDPRRAGLPEEWQTLPAFALAPGERLRIEERLRGFDVGAGNRLRLERRLWLDHAGGGWTLRDRIIGNMLSDWRLEASPPLRLEHAAQARNAEPMPITTLHDAGVRGVEWRLPAVDLSAGLRIEPRAGALPVGGWNQSFEAVSTTLHLPPGYRLLAAPGADRGSGSWLSRWTLLDLFLLALTALLAWHAAGLAGSLVAAGYLLLSYGEPGAPLYSLLLLLALVLTTRALPEGRLKRAIGRGRWAAAVLLVLLALPWAAQQARWALHPQLEMAASADTFAFGHARPGARRAEVQFAEEAARMEPPVVFDDPAPMALRAPPPPPPSPKESTLDLIEVTGTRIARADLMEGYRQSTLVQTGRALPEWRQGNVHRLHWSGPVRGDERWRPWISPPWLTALLRLLGIAFLAGTLWWLLRPRQGDRSPSASKQGPAVPSNAASLTGAVLCLGLLAATAPVPASAQSVFPPESLLQELQERLTRPPECAPQCVHLPSARVRAAQDRIEVALEVHAQTAVALPVPNDRESGAPVQVSVDGREARGVIGRQGQLLVPVDRGVHRVVLHFVPVGERSVIAFPLRPERVGLEAVGWQAGGLSEGRLPSGTLTLSRVRQPGAAAGETDEPAEQFAPYVRVVRTLWLDRLWSVDSQAYRLAPERGGFGVELALLEGERVLTPGLRRIDGRLQLPFDAEQAVAAWRSEMDRRPQLSLSAPDLAAHAEEWRVVVGPMWRVSFEGVPESNPVDGAHAADDIREFVFHPLPGETLTLGIEEPDMAEGDLLAIDRVGLHTDQGERVAGHRLELVLRSSQGGEHLIALPPGTELLGAERDGQALPLRIQDGQLSLPLRPGSQTFVLRLRSGEHVGARARLPAIDLRSPPANITLSLGLPESRWVLWTYGPRQGPAVLYWGELIVVLLLAVALAHSGLTRLRLHQWVLLALGFSTVSWAALLLVAGWLVALDWRARSGPERMGWGFNWVQIGLVLLTLVAVVVLFRVVPYGLLGLPDMHVTGNGSSHHALRWFSDRSPGELPAAGALSLPMWVYRALMLAWAIWLATALIGWMRGGFEAWTCGGYWRPWRFRKKKPAAAAEPGTEA